MNNIYKTYYQSEIGIIEITGTEEGIISILYVDEVDDLDTEEKISECLKGCYVQIDEYFTGKRKEFSLNLLPSGTDFQLKVWESLREISYGKTVSYKDIADSIGNTKAVRAVGSANGKNKISIVIPCHRVIGSNGTLTGYAGGLWRKKWLLEHEENCS